MMSTQMADVETQYKNNKGLKKEDINMLKEWLKMQPHLPPITELQLILFHHSNYYSNEATKKTIDNYFTAKTHCPEFFQNRDVNSKELKAHMNVTCSIVLSKLTPEGYGVIYTRLIDCNPDVYNFNYDIKIFSMLIDYSLRKMGCLEGHVVVMDMAGGTFTHMTKVSLSSLKKMFFFVQEAIPLRLKAIHFVNPVPFMDKMLSMVKPFMKKELQSLLNVHMKYDSLNKYVPKDCLPNEIGGTYAPISEIHASMKQILLDNSDHYIRDEKNVTDESKRPGKPKNAGDVFGADGTFKKLDID